MLLEHLHDSACDRAESESHGIGIGARDRGEGRSPRAPGLVLVAPGPAAPRSLGTVWASLSLFTIQHDEGTAQTGTSEY